LSRVSTYEARTNSISFNTIAPALQGIQC